MCESSRDDFVQVVPNFFSRGPVQIRTPFTHNESAGTAVHSDPQPAWTRAGVEALFALPFNDLLHRAQSVHRQRHDANAVQLSTLLSIKTGGCPEDCAYCPQAARYHTGVENEPLLPLEDVVAAARAAKENGATRNLRGIPRS